MKLWIVLEGDYDGDWVVAVYPNQELANQHVAALGGWAAEHEVSETIHPDVIDPQKIQEREAAAAKFRRSRVIPLASLPQ